MKGFLSALDRGLGIVCTASLVLVLPVSFLLFAQWPLRDWIQAYSREANDFAQCLFALYVSVAILYATRTRGHLAADALARGYSRKTRDRLNRVSSLVVLVPWSIFLLYTSAPMVWQSLSQIERFPETYNPGYFIIKLAVGLFGLLVLLQAVLDLTHSTQD